MKTEVELEAGILIARRFGVRARWQCRGGGSTDTDRSLADCGMTQPLTIAATSLVVWTLFILLEPIRINPEFIPL